MTFLVRNLFVGLAGRISSAALLGMTTVIAMAPLPAQAQRVPVNTPVATLAAPAMAPGPAAAVVVTAIPGVSPIFVLNSLDNSVSVINPQTWAEVKRIETGKQPHHLYLSPDEKSIIVANASSDSLTFIDPRTAEVQRTVRGVVDPYHLRFSSDMKWFVTAANRLNHIDVYRWDGTSPALVKRVPTGRTPSHLWIDSKSTTVYASIQDSDEVIALDLATQALKWRVSTGSLPADIYGTPDDRFILVGMTGGDSVEVYDVSGPSGKVPARIKVIQTGKGAHAFRAFGDKRHVLVSNRVADTISKIDLQTLEVVDKFDAPGGPDCMDVTAGGKQILVTSRWARKLTVIDVATRKVVRQVNVGRSPHGVWTLDHASR